MVNEQELSEALAKINDATVGRAHLRRILDAFDALPLVIPAAQEAERRRVTVEAEIDKRMREGEHALQALRDQATAEAGAAEKEIASLKAERDALAGEVEDLRVRVGVAREEYTKADQMRRELNERLATLRS